MTDNGESWVLSDRYLLLDRLGSGGMGTVWRATDQLLSRTVAVKEMHLRATGKELDRQAARARREAHTLARISHPNVVNVYDLVNQDDRLWLVMEFVDGPSLKERVEAGGPMGAFEVAGIGLQLLGALDAVHATGALHRDIKPGNVVLCPDGRVVLCDFGIAALTGTDSLTTTGAVVGSSGYIAPERLTGHPAGPPSDLFSLGVTLCVLLYDRSPFARPEDAGTLHAIAQEEPEIPATVGPLRSLLESLLLKNPAERPSVAEASGVLRSLTTTMASAGYDGPNGARKAGSARRRRLGLATISAALLLAVVVVAGALASPLGNGSDSTGTADPAKPPARHDSKASKGPTPTDAVMPVPDAPGEYWIFSGDHYIRGRISTSGYPVQKLLTDTSSVKAWDGTLKNLSGFQKRVDATLRVPGSSNEYWVFSGDQYIRIRVDGADKSFDDTLVAGPRPLSDWQNAFGELADDGVDAVMRTPDDPKQYWVFAGDQYARVMLDGEGPGGRVTSGPAKLNGWSTLSKLASAGQGIDAAMPVPNERNNYWVFSGAQYMKIHVTNEEYDDTVLTGSKALRNWATLR